MPGNASSALPNPSNNDYEWDRRLHTVRDSSAKHAQAREYTKEGIETQQAGEEAEVEIVVESSI